MSFNDYKMEVKKQFSVIHNQLDEEAVDTYLNEAESMSVIMSDYAMYTSTKNLAGVTPGSTASCLSMMY